ncbi:MAG: hypothetical protein KCHDKBKB_02461 [Elusimicrobia bacterium]|nr:hypothetical protein [Elusimicrobiota bacterium]MCG3205738.1 hypothetical protein [Elusimicrobiota bacterium]
MAKKGLFIFILSIVTLGTTGSAWSQAQCLKMMSAPNPSCCCPTEKGLEDCCPIPTEKTDCPMLSQAAHPAIADVPFKFAAHFDLVSVGTLVVDDVKPYLIFSDVDPSIQSVRTDLLRRSIPQFRAPPATPVAA